MTRKNIIIGGALIGVAAIAGIVSTARKSKERAKKHDELMHLLEDIADYLDSIDDNTLFNEANHKKMIKRLEILDVGVNHLCEVIDEIRNHTDDISSIAVKIESRGNYKKAVKEYEEEHKDEKIVFGTIREKEPQTIDEVLKTQPTIGNSLDW